MKEGAWIESSNGRWHWIDDHADWIRRPACARMAGLPEEAGLRIAAMPRWGLNGSDRKAILIEAMKQGLIRFRGHGAEVTFETTLPLAMAMSAVAGFMAEQFGPLTLVRVNRLPEGPCIGFLYQDLSTALEGQRLVEEDTNPGPQSGSV
jgi:hypothetical protein